MIDMIVMIYNKYNAGCTGSEKCHGCSYVPKTTLARLCCWRLCAAAPAMTTIPFKC